MKILLLGSDINTYYMARCYHELYSKKADVLGKEKMRFTYKSSIINISYNDNLRKEEYFSDILIEYSKKHYKEKVLLIPCHDIYVRLVVENKKELEKYYIFNLPSYEITNNLLIKEKFYQTYKNLEFPKTYIYNLNDKLEIENFNYPLILKPSNGIEYYKHDFLNQAKVYKLNNIEEVKKTINQIKESGYKETLIIQEYIEGDDTNLFDSVFYVNTKGKACLASFAQVGLQEHGPTAIGNATVLINNYNEYKNTNQIINKLKNFLEEIHYTGFAEFDLKYDPKDQTFKVLEINPRQARSSYYLSASGHNLIKYLIDDLYYNKVSEFKFADKKILLSMVPKYVIKKYIKNKEYKKEALKLYKKGVDPLNYKKDKSIFHKLYLICRKFKYIIKYRKFKW